MIIALLFQSCWILPSYTPNIKGKQSVDDLTNIELNGVEQSVLIRGNNKDNPILLFLHGGPGMPMMFLSHDFQRGLEKEFLVVQWDRRGAGKSYKKKLDTSTITDRQYFQDALVLIDYLTERFDEEKIFLAGHSWGTYLGSLLAHRRPDLFHAYISIGQVVDSDKSRELQEEFIRWKAEDTHRPQAIRDIEQYGYDAYEKWLFKFGGELHGDTSFQPLVKAGMRSPEYSLFDLFKVRKGSQFCQKYIRYEMIETNIWQEITRYHIPCYFIVGRFDMTTPATLIVEYYERIEAPEKFLYWFDKSAHFPFYEEEQRFTQTLTMLKRHVLSYSSSLDGDSPSDEGILKYLNE